MAQVTTDALQPLPRILQSFAYDLVPRIRAGSFLTPVHYEPVLLNLHYLIACVVLKPEARGHHPLRVVEQII